LTCGDGETYAVFMYGPCPAGHWTANAPARGHDHLQPGARYEVVQAFTDFDGDLHAVGESWTFLTSSFAPYDDGLGLFVSLDGVREWQIRLCWRPEDQGAIIDALQSYVRPA
jgi:hypothetical protein